VDDDIDPRYSSLEVSFIKKVASNKLDLGEPMRNILAVNIPSRKNPHVMPSAEQFLYDMRANETCAA
jgi:hypothetical protein